ncbi:MAG: GNAT family N-acetyltransferase [Planctomycetota bacterium]|jgi:RimJ/RimL family protein N-acetyltransferase
MSIRFPQEAHLRDERRLIIRPFAEGDVDALWEFFKRLPLPVRRYAWEDFEHRDTVEKWARDLDYDKAVPLLALDGNRVVGEARLKYREGGPLRLVGRIQWMLDPEFRGAGLGTLFINDFITMARDSGLHHLTCILFPDLDESAVITLTNLGFDRYDIPRYGVDPDGNTKDMVKMFLEL